MRALDTQLLFCLSFVVAFALKDASLPSIRLAHGLVGLVLALQRSEVLGLLLPSGRAVRGHELGELQSQKVWIQARGRAYWLEGCLDGGREHLKDDSSLPPHPLLLDVHRVLVQLRLVRQERVLQKMKK